MQGEAARRPVLQPVHRGAQGDDADRVLECLPTFRRALAETRSSNFATMLHDVIVLTKVISHIETESPISPNYQFQRSDTTEVVLNLPLTPLGPPCKPQDKCGVEDQSIHRAIRNGLKVNSKQNRDSSTIGGPESGIIGREECTVQRSLVPYLSRLMPVKTPVWNPPFHRTLDFNTKTE